MDRYDPSDTHLVFEGISTGIDNKFGLEAVFYGMGFVAYLVIVLLFIDLFLTSVTSPIFYGLFAPNRRRRRRSVAWQEWEDHPDFPKIANKLEKIVERIEYFQKRGGRNFLNGAV